jgi:hypothetical protein
MRHAGTAEPVKEGTTARRLSVAAAVALIAALSLTLVGAGPAAAVIDDSDAWPSFNFDLNGPGNGWDTAADVAVTGSATWVCGSAVRVAGNSDAALVRIPTRTSAYPPFNFYDGPAHDDDNLFDIAVKGSYVYTSGVSMNAADDQDLLVCRWSASTGAFKWARRFAGPPGMDAFASDVAVDPKGNVVVSGTMQSLTTPADWIVVKYSPKGKRLWTWRFDGRAHRIDYTAEMLIDGAGDIYITGTTATSPTSTGAHTVKLSPQGKRLWGKTLGSIPDGRAEGSCLAFTPKGGVYVGGRTYVTGEGDNAFLLRYTAGGSRMTFDTGDAGGGDVAQWIGDIAVASNGQIIGVGWTGGGPSTDRYWVRWDSDGTVGGQVAGPATPEFDLWTGVATDAFGGVYMTGLWDGPAALPQVLTVRTSVYTSGGRWSHAFEGDTTQILPQAIAVRGTTCAVAGWEQTVSHSSDWFVRMWVF